MKLTNEDAIRWLNGIKADGFSDNGEEEKETAIDMAIAALKDARPKGYWIPLTWEDEYKIVSDFPDDMDGTWVIVTDGKSISVERIKKDAYDHFFPAGRWFELDEVKAWMPLPEPYKGEYEMKSITIPDNATNGEALKALFPNTRVQEGEHYAIWNVGTDNVSFWNSWWNAPYKGDAE